MYVYNFLTLGAFRMVCVWLNKEERSRPIFLPRFFAGCCTADLDLSAFESGSLSLPARARRARRALMCFVWGRWHPQDLRLCLDGADRIFRHEKEARIEPDLLLAGGFRECFLKMSRRVMLCMTRRPVPNNLTTIVPGGNSQEELRDRRQFHCDAQCGSGFFSDPVTCFHRRSLVS